jgi:ribosomal protein S8
MAQDLISDALNQIMNAEKTEKKEVILKRHSKFLIQVLEKMKEKKHIELKIEGINLIIKILNLNECKSIKPRFYVSMNEIDKYARRFLPSRNFGVMLISTSRGLLNQHEAKENKIGGSLIAYFY